MKFFVHIDNKVAYQQIKVRTEFKLEKMAEPAKLIDMEVPAVVVIDLGHGGSGLADSLPGSSWNNAVSPSWVLEKDMTLSYGLALRNSLKEKRNQEKINLHIHMTREVNENKSGVFRANKARDKGSDSIIIIHFNASEDHKARGTLEVLRTQENVNPSEDTKLADNLVNRVVAAMHAFDSGAKKRSAVVYNTAVANDQNLGNTTTYHPVRTGYIEIDFIDFGAHSPNNPADDAVDILLNAGPNAGNVRNSVAQAMSDGVVADLIVQPTSQ